MKKWTFGIIILMVAVISSCIKDDAPTSTCTPLTVAAPDNEVATLKAKLDSIGVTAMQDSRGFFFTIDSSASTDTVHPIRCSDVSVLYKGTFFNGQGFDSSGTGTPVSFNLSGTIAGWQEAIPYMKKNAVMNLYLPPSLAYGSSQYYTIPGNSYLVFNIKLLSFN